MYSLRTTVMLIRRSIYVWNSLRKASSSAGLKSVNTKSKQHTLNNSHSTSPKWTKSPYKIKQLKYSRKIMNLVTKGKVLEAAEVFDSMRKNRIKPEIVVYNSLIAGYGREGNVRESFKVFNQMKKHALVPTDHTYTSILSACSEAGPKAEPILRKIENEMERRGVRLNNIGTNAHINALASCRQQEDALKAYLDMVNVGKSPDMYTFCGLLLASAKDRRGGMVVAQRVWQEMIASGWVPDLYSFNLLLQCLRDAGLEGTNVRPREELIRVPPIEIPSIGAQDISTTEEAAKSTNDSVRSQLKLVSVKQTQTFDFPLSNSQIAVNLGFVATEGTKSSPMRWIDRASIELLFEHLKGLNLQPDIRLFHLLLQLVLIPNTVFGHMERCSVKADERVLLTAIRVQTRLGNAEGAKALLSYSRSLGVSVDQSGYQALAASCNTESEGLQLLQEMKTAGLVPSATVFETLLTTALRAKQYEYATTLLKRMRHCEVLPCDFIVNMLEDAASIKPKSPSLVRRHNGFKGYYRIWKQLMVPQHS